MALGRLVSRNVVAPIVARDRRGAPHRRHRGPRSPDRGRDPRRGRRARRALQRDARHAWSGASPPSGNWSPTPRTSSAPRSRPCAPTSRSSPSPRPCRPDERARLLADVEEQTTELGMLVADLIELARGDEPSQEREDIRLDELVREAVTRAKRHAPSIDFRATLEPAVLDGTRERLARAVNNLLDNAAKHSPPGGIVEVYAGPSGVSVRDHGTGVDPRTSPTSSTASTAAPPPAAAPAPASASPSSARSPNNTAAPSAPPTPPPAEPSSPSPSRPPPRPPSGKPKVKGSDPFRFVGAKSWSPRAPLSRRCHDLLGPNSGGISSTSIARGVARQPIFVDDLDRRRYLTTAGAARPAGWAGGACVLPDGQPHAPARRNAACPTWARGMQSLHGDVCAARSTVGTSVGARVRGRFKSTSVDHRALALGDDCLRRSQPG